MSAKFSNKGIVILYQGQGITPDVEEAILHIIAPFVHNKSKADVFQLNSSDFAIAAAGATIKNGKTITIDFTPKTQTSPEEEAAKVVGLMFEKQLKTEDPIVLAIAVASTIDVIAHSARDTDIALLRALKLVVKPGFPLIVGSDILEKYNLNASAIQTIRTVLKTRSIINE